MGIFDRLGDVIKSYLNNEDERTFDGGRGRESTRGDPDLEAAFEELNDFLGDREGPGRQNRGEGHTGKSGTAGGRAGAGEEARSWESRFYGGTGRRENGGFRAAGNGAVPESLRGDFTELGVPFGASPEECKGAYKKLLKQHHPDRHARHPGDFQKATAKTARINAAYDRIEKWRTLGMAD
jgi:curved DNA-binding protein CbpA